MLTDKAITLSDKEFNNKNISLVKQFLITNNYPKEFVEPLIKRRTQARRNMNSSTEKSNEVTSPSHKILSSLYKRFF